MTLKTLLVAATAAGLLASPALATVTLQFSSLGAKLSNIQNAAGTATGGLNWGIVISTTANGFASSGAAYDGFVLPSPRNDSGTFLSAGGSLTDDYFYWGTTANAANTTTLASSGGTESGTNVINSIVGVPLTGAITAGDRFAIMWFDTGGSSSNGAKYGFLDSGFVLPSEGSTTDFSSTYVGTDPTRLASNTFGGAAPVPEPSRMMLLGFGLIGLFFRRRR
jgi:hypothetical protein